MKQRFEKFPGVGANPHDQSGRTGVVCRKCRTEVPAKPGFRLSSLKCPKCGAAVQKP